MLLLQDHKDLVRSLAYSPNGAMLASGSNDKRVKLWDIMAGVEKHQLKPHKRIVNSVVFSHDGRILASGSSDRTIRFWDPASGALLDTLTGHTTSVSSLAFSPDDKRMASGSGNAMVNGPNGELILWDLHSSKSVQTLPVGHSGVISTTFTPNGKVIAFGTGIKAVVLWEPSKTQSDEQFGMEQEGYDYLPVWSPSGSRQRPPLLQKANARSLAFSPIDKILAASSGYAVNLWDYQKRICLATLEGHQDNIWSLAFSPNGRQIATASHDGTVRIWNVSRLAQQREFNWGIGRVNSIAFSPDGMTAAAGGDRDIAVWDMEPD